MGLFPPLLMSVFDPATSNLFSAAPSLFWAGVFLAPILVSSFLWVSLGLVKAVVASAFRLVSPLVLPNRLPGFPLVLVSLFIFLAVLNLMGLLPYVFTFTVHPAVPAACALPMWGALLVSSGVLYPAETLASFVPKGAPAVLIPLLFCSEVVSAFVRPLTLTIRLATNMMAGHLILGLLAFLTGSWAVGFLVLFPFTVLEVGVALIQAFIFVLLLSVYAKEHV